MASREALAFRERVRPVYGIENLCDALDCTREWVRVLAGCGAPIIVKGHGNGTRYIASLTALERWLSVPRVARRLRRS